MFLEGVWLVAAVVLVKLEEELVWRETGLAVLSLFTLEMVTESSMTGRYDEAQLRRLQRPSHFSIGPVDL
ncbi:uncharacterized protein YALI1_D17814g [Yarrowia lipolytica]|uniref:Secreted protein n=1 Tax=Yarrowia lipolytica TaxID=4952 RepID=A0A1D8NEJ9_YARLL|nr:hypothetical protein YALI1_D17814g [Yarrowia lipolytica]